MRIMTVHASKGLEFPIVAVAELRSVKQESSSLVAADVNGSLYLSLDTPSMLLKKAGNWVGSSEYALLADEMLGLASDEESEAEIGRRGGVVALRMRVERAHARPFGQ